MFHGAERGKGERYEYSMPQEGAAYWLAIAEAVE